MGHSTPRPQQTKPNVFALCPDVNQPSLLFCHYEFLLYHYDSFFGIKVYLYIYLLTEIASRMFVG